MKIYKHYKYIVFYTFVAVFLTAAPSLAEKLSDDEAYERVLTVCSQTVYPRPQKGEVIDESRYALTPDRLQKIAACMREKGVPVVFDAEEFSIVRTSSGFGGDVDVKAGGLFPADTAAQKKNPYRVKESLLPDPDYSQPENKSLDAAGYDESNADLAPPETRRRESPSSKRPTVRSGSIGVITDTENDKNGGNDDVKPIFLPR